MSCKLGAVYTSGTIKAKVGLCPNKFTDSVANFDYIEIMSIFATEN